MSKRGDAELVEDIAEAIARIERYTAGATYEAFLQDTLRQDAVVRNLGIIGEAVKRLSPEFRKQRPTFAGQTWPECAIGWSTITSASIGRSCGT